MGGVRCRVCLHTDFGTIDRGLVDGVSLSTLAAQYGMSKMSLSRHRDNHLVGRLAVAETARAQDPAQVTASDEKIVDRLARLADAAEVYALTMLRAGAPNAPQALRECRETLARVGEFRGELREPVGHEHAKTMLDQLVDGLRGERDSALVAELAREFPAWSMDRILEEAERRDSAGWRRGSGYLHPHLYEPTRDEDYPEQVPA